jgi:outer membrane biosynthesis protein TonB
VVPSYDPLARQTLIQGDVSVHIHIGKNGAVESVSDVQGPKLLSEEVTKAVMSWTYDLKTEEKAEVVTIFRFSLEGPKAQDTKFVRVSGDLPNLVEIVTNPPQTAWP